VLITVFALRRWGGVTKPVSGLLVSSAIALGAAFLAFLVLPRGRQALRDAKDLLPLLVKRSTAEK